MKSLLSWPIDSKRIWEFSLVLILFYLLFYPPMIYPQSAAVALGGGLLLLWFKAVPPGSVEIMGRAWWIFLAYLLLSCPGSLVPGLTLQSAGFAFVGTLLYLMAQSNDDETKKRLEVWGLLMALAACWLALRWFFASDQVFLDNPNLPKMEFRIVEKAVYYHRPSGSLATAGALAALLILLLPWVVVQAWTNRGFKRFFYLFCTFPMLFTLWTTKSVGAWGVLTLAVLLVFLWRGLWKWAGLIVLGGTAVILGIIWVRGAQHWGISSFDMRLLLWKSAWQLFLQHPWLGSGLGTFDEAYQAAGYSLDQGGARYPHNLLLQLLSETGLLGTGLFLAALAGFLKRLKYPSRWEGWGILAGTAAFFLFSFLDLPFQMPELVWFFAVLAGRLELKPEKPLRLPTPRLEGLEWILLGVLMVSGFWPPFRPWNMALLACTLWMTMAFLGQKLGSLPLWVLGGGLFISLRAFFSPSSLGAVWFLESAGLLLAFSLLMRGLPSPEGFFRKFCAVGMAWALQVWSFSFRYSDMKDWHIFPNPKQVGIFLLAWIFLGVARPVELKNLRNPWGQGKGRLWGPLGFLFSAATWVCLKAFGAIVGFAVASVGLVKREQRKWAWGAAAFTVAGTLFYRARVFQSLDLNSTRWDRLLIWKAGLLAWLKNPLWGAGPGVFAGLFHQLKDPRTSGVSRYLMDAQYAHNEFLDFSIAFGLIGLVWAFFLLRKFWPTGKPGRQAALTALATASFFDFCLHAPLIALQGAGLLGSWAKKRAPISWAGGFLAAGLCLGLFGAAAWVPALQDQARGLEGMGRYPETLQCLRRAGQLNPWDARVAAAKADFLEKMYLATQDSEWERQSDDAFQRVLDLEPTDGQWKFQNAERLSQRLGLGKTRDRVQAARQAWQETGNLLPTNALVRYEEGLFLIDVKEGEGALADFRKAVELEPNYAAAWANLGFLLLQKGQKEEARTAFKTALQVHDQWKDVPRISGLERQLVDLPPQVAGLLGRETR